jgi:MGT family glycosyltransferase
MTQKSFLFPVWEGGGNIPPVLSVTRKLKAAGHHIRIMSDACNRSEAEAAGAEFIAWTRAPSRPDKSPATDIIRDWDVASPVEGLARVFERIMFGPAALYAADVEEEIDRRAPDAIVCNEMLFGAMVAAEARQIPFSLLCPNVSLFPIEGIPPLGPGLMPARTEEERVLHARITQGNREMFNQGLPALNAARASLGLAPLAHVYEQVDRALQILLATARSFDFAPETLPSRFHYVGPQFHDQQADEDWISPLAEDGDPVILLSFSTTFQNQGAAIQRVITALSGLPLQLVVTLGPALKPPDFDCPANAMLLAHAPHGPLMEQARAVIAHGGHGTVMRALAKDCPLLIMPHGRDQNDNAVRVMARGAGLTLDPATTSAADIAAAVMRLISEPSFAKAAAALGGGIRTEAARSPIVSLLETLASPLSAAA